MATFSKNWQQIKVSPGEPFQMDYLDRKFGGRSRKVFFVDDQTGQVLINQRQLTDGKPKISVGVLGAGAANAVDVTIQLKDVSGVNLKKFSRVQVWVTDTTTNATKTPIGTDTTGLTTSVVTGTVALTKLANLDFDIITNASGKIVVRLTDAAGAQTRFVNVAVNGVIYTSTAVVTS